MYLVVFFKSITQWRSHTSCRSVYHIEYMLVMFESDNFV